MELIDNYTIVLLTWTGILVILTLLLLLWGIQLLNTKNSINIQKQSLATRANKIANREREVFKNKYDSSSIANKLLKQKTEIEKLKLKIIELKNKPDV